MARKTPVRARFGGAQDGAGDFEVVGVEGAGGATRLDGLRQKLPARYQHV